jgi:hypothetical protein
MSSGFYFYNNPVWNKFYYRSKISRFPAVNRSAESISGGNKGHVDTFYFKRCCYVNLNIDTDYIKVFGYYYFCSLKINLNKSEMTESNIVSPQEQENKKRTPVMLIVITLFLMFALTFLVFSYFGQKNRMIEMETTLTQEKDSLANELRLMIHGYDTLKTNNDTLNAKLEVQKTRIRQLLSINASNIQLIKTYKSEIGTMREIMKSYIVQIDSLNTRNKILVAENQDIKQQITTVQKTNVELSKVKEALNTKVEIASIIQAKDVVAVSLNKNRKETTRLDRLDKLRICFTLRENPIAKAGQKMVYLRIIRPDSLVITSSPDNLFDFNGTKMIFTANRQAEYLNQDIDMCIFVDNTGDFILGNYKAELYLDGNLIGGCSFILTKR